MSQNPVQYAMAAQPWTVPGVAQVIKPGIHDRIQLLARKVEFAKAQKLTAFEFFLKYLGAVICAPFTLVGISGVINVPANTTIAIFRFGKLDRVIRKPGLALLPPFFERVQCFTGTQSHKMLELHVVDAAGNPIIVRALMEYSVEDPAALHIATQSSMIVLHNQAEQVVREACSKLPLLGEKGHDIRSQTHEISDSMIRDLQPDASVFGVIVQRIVIVEARYAPEIASQMLLKQQAAAMVAARKEIVAGALSIVQDTLQEFPGVSVQARERIITNMLVTLTSHAQATPTIPMDS